MAKKTSLTLLSAAAAVANGTAQAVENFQNFMAFYEAAGGANLTAQIQAKTPAGNWVAIDSRAIAADGNTVVSFSGPFKEIRGAVTARTAGNVTLTVEASGKAS